MRLLTAVAIAVTIFLDSAAFAQRHGASRLSRQRMEPQPLPALGGSCGLSGTQLEDIRDRGNRLFDRILYNRLRPLDGLHFRAARLRERLLDGQEVVSGNVACLREISRAAETIVNSSRCDNATLLVRDLNIAMGSIPCIRESTDTTGGGYYNRERMEYERFTQQYCQYVSDLRDNHPDLLQRYRSDIDTVIFDPSSLADFSRAFRQLLGNRFLHPQEGQHRLRPAQLMSAIYSARTQVATLRRRGLVSDSEAAAFMDASYAAVRARECQIATERTGSMTQVDDAPASAARAEGPPSAGGGASSRRNPGSSVKPATE